MKTEKEIYAWMDKQIEATEIRCTPLDKDDPFNICIAGSDKKIHVYGIDDLCKKLNIPWKVKDFSDDSVEYYFVYKGYTFFGLVNKEKTDEGK